MTSVTEKLASAQKYAMSIRPKIGGFPVLAEVLRQAGVETNYWTLPSCQAIYLMQEGSVLQQGTPLLSGIHEIPEFDQAALIRAIRIDQQGNSTFPEFLQSAWNAGVVSYEVDLKGRKVVYSGVNGEQYLEEYPAVDLQK